LDLREPAMYQESQLKNNKRIMEDQEGDHHLLPLVKSRPELNVSPKKIKDDLLYHDEAVQTDLTANQVTKMEQARFKLLEQRNKFKKVRTLLRNLGEYLAKMPIASEACL